VQNFSPKLQFGVWKNEIETRLIHASSRKIECCMSRNGNDDLKDLKTKYQTKL
jgi:hypothetical protein